MPPDRFEWLEEDEGLPANLKEAIQKLNRFERLEIGTLGAAPPASAAPPIAAPAASPSAVPPPKDAVVCLHCGQPNEKERDVCWACHRWVRVQAKPVPGSPDQELTVLVDGVTYNSTDDGIPENIAELMAIIRKGTYSPQTLAEWRARWSRRKTAAEPLEGLTSAPEAPAGRVRQGDVEVFQGNRVTVLRIDGKMCRSDDPSLTPELKNLFAYIERNGVTPALMEYLRQFGDKVKYRPSDTAIPTDGDLDFWKKANSGDGAEAEEDAAARRRLEAAQSRYDKARAGIPQALVVLGLTILYFWLRFFLKR